MVPEEGRTRATARTVETDTDGAGVPEAPAPQGAPTPLDLVRQLVAERAELPLAAVGEESRLLSDLHLNSISVGQLVAEAARRLGLRPPTQVTDYARSTVAEVAAVLAEQQRTGDRADGSQAPEAPPSGIAAWVRAFSTRLADRPLPPRTRAAEPDEWRVVAPPDLAGASELAGGRGVALCLPAEMGEEHLPLFVEAARFVLEGPRPLRFLLVEAGGVGGGFARTLHLEHPEVATVLVHLDADLPLAGAAADVAAEARAPAAGFAEVRLGAGGRRRVPGLEAVE